jgi:hypothetical protein
MRALAVCVAQRSGSSERYTADALAGLAAVVEPAVEFAVDIEPAVDIEFAVDSDWEPGRWESKLQLELEQVRRQPSTKTKSLCNTPI